MKNLLTILVSWFLGLFKSKTVKTVVDVPAKPETLSEKLEKIEEKKHIYSPKQNIPPHNNRKSKKNRRGVRSRFTQYTPSGRAIYHDILSDPNETSKI